MVLLGHGFIGFPNTAAVQIKMQGVLLLITDCTFFQRLNLADQPAGTFFAVIQERVILKPGKGEKEHQAEQRDHDNQFNQCETATTSVADRFSGDGPAAKICIQYVTS